MVTIIVNTKGGTGKSLISFQVLSLVLKDFKIYELDDHNNTAASFINSDILKDKTQNSTIDKAEDLLDDIFFEAQTKPDLNIIIDVGGGSDTQKLLEYIKQQPLQNSIKYLIPITAADSAENMIETYNMIPKSENIHFILNSYMTNDLKSEFLFFFGDKKLGINSLESELNKKLKYFKIPFSNFFIISKTKYKMTITDLASKSKDLSTEEASKSILEAAAGDSEKYKMMYNQYRVSLKTADLCKTIKDNLSDFK